jgi:N utilization substance protein A
MSNEILSVLEYMEKEKGISREDMISAIINAIKGAALRGSDSDQDLKIEIDPKTGEMQAWANLQVVETVSDPKMEILLDKARQEKEDAQVGDCIEREIDPAYLGRIAAQTARQTIMQRLRQFEKERIYDDYKDMIGDIVSGVARRVPGEDYAPGERIRCLLLNIDHGNRGPELILSRASVRFVRRLFELEVTEIADGTVTIETISREPGYRTKIAVNSNDSKVDPVGACVGARGARVKSIVRELSGEKIDIIRHYSDPVRMLEEAIKPAVPKNINLDEANRRIFFEVSEDDLSVAIGRRGQNARLTSRLLGWKLDISKEQKLDDGFEARVEAAVAGWHDVSGISDETAQGLVNMGIVSPEAFIGVELNDLIDTGFSENEAKEIIEKVSEYRETNKTTQ